MAMSLQAGVEPLAYLRADEFELRVLNEVLRQAAELIVEKERSIIDANGITVGNAIGRIFGGKSRK